MPPWAPKRKRSHKPLRFKRIGSSFARQKTARRDLQKNYRRLHNRRVLSGGYAYTGAGGGSTSRGQAKVAYQLKKYGGQPRISKKMLSSLYGDNVVALTYLDRVATTGTTGSSATQAIWGNRISTAGSNASTRTSSFNLVVHDPNILQMYNTSTVGSLSGTNGPKTLKLFVKNYRVKAVLTNLENGPIEIWEYRCLARTRIATGTWATIMATIADPGATAASSTNAVNPAGMTVPTATAAAIELGATPFHFGAFTKWLKVTSVKKKFLNPADRWEIKYSCKKPMIFDNEKFNIGVQGAADGNNAATVLWEGMGFSVFVMKGTFAVDSAGATTQKFGIGNATVGIEYQIGFHYSIIGTNQMTAQVVRDAAGFTRDDSGYPANVVRTVNLNAISTGPTPAAAGTNVWGPSGLAVQDDAMSDED